MGDQSGRGRRWLTLAGGVLGLSLAACTVWKTQGPEETDPRVGIDRQGRVRPYSGLPYFLPRGMIHLAVIAQPATTDAGTDTAKTAVPVNHVTYKVSAKVEMVPDRAAGVYYAHYQPNWLFHDATSIGITPDGLLNALSATVEDRTPQVLSNLEDAALDTGKFFLTGGLSALGGLSTPPSGSSNALATRMSLADARKFVALTAKLAGEIPPPTRKFFYQLPTERPFNFEAIPLNVPAFAHEDEELRRADRALFRAKRIAERLETLTIQYDNLEAASKVAGPKTPPQIYVKRINIDEVFDPFDPRDCKRIASLFDDQLEAKDKPGSISTYSPLKIEITYPGQEAKDVRPRLAPSRAGLWFREPAQVEILVRHNTDHLEAICKTVQTKAELAGLVVRLQGLHDAAIPLGAEADDLLAQIKENIPEINAVWDKPPAQSLALEFGEDELKKVLKSLDDTRSSTFTMQQRLKTFQTNLEATIKALIADADTKRDNQYFGNLLGETAGIGRYSCIVPNPNRPYSLNVPRSAFVSRTMSMTIQNGNLLGFSHTKPSEVEGFTNIPVTLAKKIVGIPSALYSGREENIQGQDSVIKANTQLINDQRALEAARYPTPLPSATP